MKYDIEKVGYLDYLKEMKANGTLTSSVSTSAVLAAAENGYLDVVKWLVLESGQEIDCRGCENWEVQTLSADQVFQDALASLFRGPAFGSTADCLRFMAQVGELQSVMGMEQWKETWKAKTLRMMNRRKL